MLQYGADRVARYLRVDAGDGRQTGAELAAALDARHEPTPGRASVFSRFLRHLAYLELPRPPRRLPELHWFPPTGAGR